MFEAFRHLSFKDIRNLAGVGLATGSLLTGCGGVSGGTVNNEAISISRSTLPGYLSWDLTLYPDKNPNLVVRDGTLPIRGNVNDPLDPIAHSSNVYNQIRGDLLKVGNLSSLPPHNCPKIPPDMAALTVSYRGKVTGDLDCISSDDSTNLLALKTDVENVAIHFQ